ncbi:MAG TPA: ATP-binding cassette domain-containing protein [Crocinitomicaceae bacterium]|nr:ATP-binding cassette domain-containing protein [Crocinitomicaceae bacterium]
MSTTILQVNGLSKSYKDVKALDNLSLDVKQGTVFGLLGPNGSGKTTTLGILLGVINQKSGNYSWFDNGDKTENRRKIGALLETPNFYPYLSAVKNLEIVTKIKNIDNPLSQIESVLKEVNLFERKDSKFRTFSLGMKQRLAIASALLGSPEVLVLDEPTNGLDPQGIAEIRELIQKIANDNRTIIIASHILDEIEKVCTHVAILKFGKLIKQGTIGEIIGGENYVIIASRDMKKLLQVINEDNEMSVFKKTETEVIVKVDKETTTKKVNQFFFDKGIVLSQLKAHSESLETQFLEIIK